MTTYRRLAWTAATLTYLLIVLGAWVRITGSGMGCGDHWPLCNGRLVPPLDDLGTLIEWTHRLVAALVSLVVLALAASAWWLRRGGARRSAAPDAALGLLAFQVLLGAVTVKLELPPWTVILHFGTALALLATLIVAAASGEGERRVSVDGSALVAGALAAATLLFGALTANLGAAAACGGFPLCNGQIIPSGGGLQHLHWTHRLLAYALTGYTIWWAARTRSRGALLVLALVLLQVTVAALMVTGGLPRALQALHVAVGAAVWATLVVVALRPTGSGVRTAGRPPRLLSPTARAS